MRPRWIAVKLPHPQSLLHKTTEILEMLEILRNMWRLLGPPVTFKRKNAGGIKLEIHNFCPGRSSARAIFKIGSNLAEIH